MGNILNPEYEPIHCLYLHSKLSLEFIFNTIKNSLLEKMQTKEKLDEDEFCFFPAEEEFSNLVLKKVFIKNKKIFFWIIDLKKFCPLLLKSLLKEIKINNIIISVDSNYLNSSIFSEVLNQMLTILLIEELQHSQLFFTIHKNAKSGLKIIIRNCFLCQKGFINQRIF